MKARACLGIDPGQSGGIAIVDPTGMPWAVKMPETERDLWDMIREAKTWGSFETHAVIELVHSSPQMGVKSAFTFGGNYKSLRMALIAADIPFREVRPQAWQKAMGCLTGGDKNITKAKAQQLFPGIKVTHALADALLLAEWLRRQP